MKTWIAVLLSVVTLGAPGASQVVSGKVGISVSSGTARLSFGEYGGIGLDLKYLSGAATIEQAEILFENNLKDISYVVVHLAGPTKNNGGGGYCGAGTEENLVWIKLSHTVILDVRSILYSSCAFSIEPTQLPEATTRGLHVDYVSYSEGRDFRATYDDTSPENGFVVASMPKGPRPRAEELVATLAKGDWTTAARFVYLDANTRTRMGIARGAGIREARPKIETWFKQLYGVVRPGRVVSVKIDPTNPA